MANKNKGRKKGRGRSDGSACSFSWQSSSGDAEDVVYGLRFLTSPQQKWLDKQTQKEGGAKKISKKEARAERYNQSWSVSSLFVDTCLDAERRWRTGSFYRRRRLGFSLHRELTKRLTCNRLQGIVGRAKGSAIWAMKVWSSRLWQCIRCMSYVEETNIQIWIFSVYSINLGSC